MDDNIINKFITLPKGMEVTHIINLKIQSS
jgi:hypothetical protein